MTDEQRKLTNIVRIIYNTIHTDGKYIINGNFITICQSWMEKSDYTYLNGLLSLMNLIPTINPLGDWTGGVNVDTGATNRKLGSDMGDAATGGGLHGKDLSKADVSINIYCSWLADTENAVVTAHCNIGDTNVEVQIDYGDREAIRRVPFKEIVACAREYINDVGGFEKLAEWGLI